MSCQNCGCGDEMACHYCACPLCIKPAEPPPEVPAPDEVWVIVNPDGSPVGGRNMFHDPAEAAQWEAFQQKHGNYFELVRYVRSKS